MMKPYRTSDQFVHFLPNGIGNLIEGDLLHGRCARLLALWESHLSIHTFFPF